MSNELKGLGRPQPIADSPTAEEAKGLSQSEDVAPQGLSPAQRQQASTWAQAGKAGGLMRMAQLFAATATDSKMVQELISSDDLDGTLAPSICKNLDPGDFPHYSSSRLLALLADRA